MTPKQFYNLKTGDLLCLSKSNLVSFLHWARNFGVFNVLPHPDSIFLITDIEITQKNNTGNVVSAQVHYISGLGKIGTGLLNAMPEIIQGFEIIQKQ